MRAALRASLIARSFPFTPAQAKKHQQQKDESMKEEQELTAHWRYVTRCGSNRHNGDAEEEEEILWPTCLSLSVRREVFFRRSGVRYIVQTSFQRPSWTAYFVLTERICGKSPQKDHRNRLKSKWKSRPT